MNHFGGQYFGKTNAVPLDTLSILMIEKSELLVSDVRWN
jgi:hypothetical protein